MFLSATFSELLGYTSIACWLGAQFPQVIENHKRQSCEGLALPFLCNWLLGDFSNLIGCLLTHQLPFQTYLATYFCIVDCSLLAQYFYYGGGPAIPSEVYGRTRSRTLSTARRLSIDASHYRTLSAVAGNVAAAAALVAFPEAHPEHRVSRKHPVDQPLHDTTPQVSEEAQDEVDDAVLSALSESFHSGRKRVSWSQERRDHLSAVPKSLQITSPQREFAAFARGRPEQRAADADEVEVEVGQAGSRAASGHRTSSRASRRAASMVLLGFGALFSVGALTDARSRSLAERNDSIGRVLADEVVIPHSVTASSVQDAAYYESSSDAEVVTVELPSTLDQDELRSQSEDLPSAERIIGRIFAWLCTSLYLTSRLPQIWKNYARKSVDGLSMYLFVFAFLGNFFYVCSILTSPEARVPPPASIQFFKESLPYLLGSGGTFIFDVTIVSQSFIYRGKPPRRRGRGASIVHRASLAEEQAGLLGGDALSGSYYGGRSASVVAHSRSRTSASTLRIPSPSPPVSNQQFAEPQPDHLRAFVLDYLCHNCYTKTAQAFARDTTVRHLDKDGDEIMSPDRRLQGNSVDLTEEGLRRIRLREEIRTEILSGRIDEATALLNQHFPSVLASSSVSHSETSSSVNSSSDRIESAPRTVLDPTLLSLNLRIHAFIEACRTIPLPYVPPHRGVPIETPEPPMNLSRAPDRMTGERYQTELILRAQKLYALVELLRKPEDRATYLKELENVGGLLAYKVPEISPMSKYLDQARRERVADQINRAILHHNNLLSVSHLEVAVRYNSSLWGALNELHAEVPTRRPAGVTLPPKPASRTASTSDEKKPTVEVSFTMILYLRNLIWDAVFTTFRFGLIP
ncbi:PQ loop repeat-domain-containing protein [Suillus paluster]|uniref:PQ loop repeat-domain-containing protein n=1 Tax=Suillus paluster TaxID=48578 RepID=UPI001B86FF63|nr:PQ loop repeat-domain-containing protein [Suillus paluster]KAG1756668.1 PQ loop repeat-domain-containing protein [Suillus paluster]